ncbi:uncharacterized protein LOC143285835 [Babylonia areolata]|uniref:uncharacterized protein LOC143285835 n=1 Tax=Babylonia areolata TaxID=304850 RepID=UPI003FD3773A
MSVQSQPGSSSTGVKSELSSGPKQQVFKQNERQEFRLHEMTAERQDKASDRNEPSTLTGLPERSIPERSASQPETQRYSSKWVSAVAACISAQPSLFSVLYSPVSAVLAPFIRSANIIPNPVLFSLTSSSSADVGRMPMTNLSNSINMGTRNQSTESAVAKNNCSRRNKENKTLRQHGDGPANKILMSASGGKPADRYCNFQQKDSVLFCPSNTRRDDQGAAQQRFEEAEELGLRPSSQKCPKCSLEFFTHADLLFHMSVHEADNNSSQGENTGAQRGGHLSDTDAGEARNKCGVCSRVFTRSWLLKGHMRTHTGERPFHCTWPQCQRAFADKSNLRSHMLIHTTTAKSFTCPKCSRAFSQKRYLHKHMLEVCRII